MAAGEYQASIDGVFYYGTFGSQASTDTDNVDDVELGLSTINAKILRRGKLWEATKVLAFTGQVSFTIVAIEGDAFFSAIQTAFFARALIALWPTDLAAAGEGLDADYTVTEFSRTESNRDVVKYKVTAMPSDESRDPIWQ